ncbi:cryptochrome/photolyase family protein [Terricaulis sp.]|uniref:cryptochrome/photolyase family protein n=1 Tax=Terricaulis sp. TaxID=2768686 RepID=UPI002AC6A9D9|nr:cryptochrome/photolyase family protein [Terricaulis sp.]MDZ4693437.1 cryptochrome/photolyase family protein [Terricaulis sp.]
MVQTLRLLLGDQLSPRMASLRDLDPARDVVMLAEVAAEATYVRHHKKKIAFVFAAMRAFADELSEQGVTVRYVQLDDPLNTGSLGTEIARAVSELKPAELVLTEPGEHRLAAEMESWEATLGIPVEVREDSRFICSHAAFRAWAKERKQLRMEYFYREMRRCAGVLLDGEEPAGGRWNYDSENRKPADADLFMPKPPHFAPDAHTREVLDLVATRFADHVGDLEPFWFAVTHAQAEEALRHFLVNALPSFGDYQDAMLSGEPFLYHSVISMYLNAGLLDARDICRRAEAEYRAGRVSLNNAEGFIRQILGWREFVRGVYWLRGPDYLHENALGATRNLPWFYWSGETEMACLKAAIGQTKREAYAHHIQRLMVTGNFAMLAGVDPYQVHEWYLAVYADAYEWVEAPNTIGMSQFADGGVVGSKPYASSGAYIDRMSDYCGSCVYDVKAKAGPKACPFNYLYWDFLARNRDKLEGNPRMAPMFKTLERMSDERRAEIADDARKFLEALQ